MVAISIPLALDWPSASEVTFQGSAQMGPPDISRVCKVLLSFGELLITPFKCWEAPEKQLCTFSSLHMCT